MENVEYSKDGKALIEAYDVEGHFIVPNGVTKIGVRAFYGCSIKYFSVDEDNPEYTSDTFGRL